MNGCCKFLAVLLLVAPVLSLAQPLPPGRGRGADWKALHGPPGRWWNNPQIVQQVGVTTEQQKKLDDIYQQYRLKLIDSNAALDREEATLEPLVNADPPDDAKVIAQLDHVAQARAELEKVNARMLWSLRRVLTSEQWKKLRPEPPALPSPKWR
jgi:Spy/CpxP family protein refolding chaperone